MTYFRNSDGVGRKNAPGSCEKNNIDQSGKLIYSITGAEGQ